MPEVDAKSCPNGHAHLCVDITLENCFACGQERARTRIAKLEEQHAEKNKEIFTLRESNHALACTQSTLKDTIERMKTQQEDLVNEYAERWKLADETKAERDNFKIERDELIDYLEDYPWSEFGQPTFTGSDEILDMIRNRINERKRKGDQ